MYYSYVGLIKKNTQTSKVLVLSEEGKYYVWEANNNHLSNLNLALKWEIPYGELMLATPRQIDVGRGVTWVPNGSNVLVPAVFQGVVSGGKNNKTILVKSFSGDWLVIVVPYESIKGLERGASIFVDSRGLVSAREDHIKAGLGFGTLKRRKRVSV